VLDGARVAGARIAFGGMAATPKRARAAEAALRGADLRDPASWRPALAALGEDFTPISDMRAGAEYRRATAQALLKKALGEIAGTPSAHTRVVGRREHVDAAAT